jgi:hypothetical protein
MGQRLILTQNRFSNLSKRKKIAREGRKGVRERKRETLFLELFLSSLTSLSLSSRKGVSPILFTWSRRRIGGDCTKSGKEAMYSPFLHFPFSI